MTGMPSSSAQEHWSGVWRRLVEGEAIRGDLNALPGSRKPKLEEVLESATERFLSTDRQNLAEHLRSSLSQISARLHSSQALMFICPRDRDSGHVCVQLDSHERSPLAEQMMASAGRWKAALNGQTVQIIEREDGDEAAFICASLSCQRVILLSTFIDQQPGACLMLGTSPDTWIPDASECALLSAFLQLAYLVTDRLAVQDVLRQRDSLLQRTERLAGIGSWHNDLLQDCLTFTAQSGEIFGFSADTRWINTRQLLERIHPDDRHRVAGSMQRSSDTGEGFDIICRVCPRAEELRLVRVLADVVTDGSGKVVARFGSVQDITEAHERTRQLQQAAQVLESAMEGVLIVDALGRVESVNPAFTAITGYPASEVVGVPVQVLDKGSHNRAFFRSMLRQCIRQGSWRGEIMNRRRNGELFPQLLSVTVLRDDHGRISQFVAVFSDMSRIRKSEKQVDYLAAHDALTGLPNRAGLMTCLQKAIDKAAIKRRRVAVITIDLDHFKHINDSLGHPAGDRLLQACARRLRERLRDSDTVARQGGDEFVVVLENVVSQKQVEQVAGILQDLFAKGFDVGTGRELFIGASLGITLYPEHGSDVTQLLSYADVAMYAAKQQGRNHYRFYTNELTQAASDRLELGSQLRAALQSDDELQIWYQPQVDQDSGNMVGAEALLRWQHPQEGLIHPGRFIPVAEDNGLMPDMDHWVLTHVCQQLAQWQQEGQPPFVVAVNITQPTFIAGGLVDRLQELLARYRIDPTWLELEITEGALLEPTPQVLNTIEGLKALGISLAVDDFGTGYSSLAYLQRFRVDKLKIDRRFVSSVEEEEEGRVITSTIINMARGLGLAVLAEGVETEGQRAYLREQGCTICQGFLFSRPLPLDAFSDWLKY